MTRLLYIDCPAGVAGDMLLGALLDAGADAGAVAAGLAALPLPEMGFDVHRADRHGIRAARVLVRDVPEHVHRTWADVREIVDAAGLPERARLRAQEAFRRLAEAEATVHGISPEDVHFHEVGARDALADVCGVMLALESLAADRVECSPLPMARGVVDAAHGRLPLPAPATLELLRGVPVYGTAAGAELVTPTGAALVATLAAEFGEIPPMRLERTGYGAGARDLEALPNVVRVLVGAAGRVPGGHPVSLLETNLDDLPPELVADAGAGCFAAGALDVWVTPAQMKKGRLGVVMSALARPDEEYAVARALLRETSALGVRVARLQRWELERGWETVEVRGEPVRVKVGRLDGEVVNVAPEHDDCATAAARLGVPVKSVWTAAFAAAGELEAGLAG
jgi:uncharacterized protein (TIGR00299 family) protein